MSSLDTIHIDYQTPTLSDTSTSFSGTSSLSQTSPHKCSSENTQLYDGYFIGSLLAKRIPSHSYVGSAISSNQVNQQRLLPGLRLENLPVLKYWGVTLLRLLMFLKSSERSLNNQPKRRTLWLKSSYWWPTHRNGAVQINDHFSCNTSWV